MSDHKPYIFISDAESSGRYQTTVKHESQQQYLLGGRSRFLMSLTRYRLVPDWRDLKVTSWGECPTCTLDVVHNWYGLGRTGQESCAQLVAGDGAEVAVCKRTTGPVAENESERQGAVWQYM